MYTNNHSSIGASILVLTGFSWIGIILAISSHFAVDLIQENYYNQSSKTLEIELFWLISIIGLSLLSLILFNANMAICVLFGAILGNLVDIIDKFRSIVLKKEEIFFCHKQGYEKIKESDIWIFKIIPSRYVLFAILIMILIMKYFFR